MAIPSNLHQKKVAHSDNMMYFCSYMVNQKPRTITLYKNYFSGFYHKQRQKVKDKILWTFRLIETTQLVPTDYLKYMEGTDGLYEIRVKLGSDIFRIFCFFDEGKIIVLANGFQKKIQKTPKSEIEKALKIKKEYESEKQHKNP
jgi:phage-related protein